MCAPGDLHDSVPWVEPVHSKAWMVGAGAPGAGCGCAGSRRATGDWSEHAASAAAAAVQTRRRAKRVRPGAGFTIVSYSWEGDRLGEQPRARARIADAWRVGASGR